MLPELNSTVAVDDLVRLNDALRKSSTGGTVGYQTGAVPDAGASLSPLVPQSIENMLSVATHTMQEIVFWKSIPKKSVGQTLHEYVVVNEHGMDLDPFIGEGGGGSADFGLSQAQYTRKSVKIKYMAERRQITDVASLVGLIGDNRQALAEETERGTLALMRKVENALFHGDESLNGEGFDGVIKQLKDAGSSYDMKGSVPTPMLLQEVLGDRYAVPNFAKIDTILVEPRIHAELIRQSVESGRHDQLSVRDSSSLTWGAQNLSVMSPYGAVKIQSAPFLFTAHAAPSVAQGESPITLAFGGNCSAVVGTPASSDLAAGDYIYKVIAVSKKGASAPATSAAQTVAAGDAVTLSLPADSNVLYFKIYRSEKNGSADSCKMVARIPQTGAGAIYEDKGQHKYNSSNILMLQNTPDAIEFMRLLDFIRRPLAEVSTVKPFLLMLFGALSVKLPNKHFVLEQVGFSDTTGMNPNYLNPNF